MPYSSTAGWISFGLLPASAIVGMVLRRLGHGSFVIRLRPHFILGYAAILVALYHGTASLGSLPDVNSTGISFAVAATGGLAIQTFVGASLQAPGIYRETLRRWHLRLFFATVVLVLVHVFYNAPSIA